MKKENEQDLKSTEMVFPDPELAMPFRFHH